MSKLALWVELEAKPGKENELEEFLKSAQPLAEREPRTVTWYAIKMGGARYGIFDTFAEENGRNAHLNGEIAKGPICESGPTLGAAAENQQTRNCGFEDRTLASVQIRTIYVSSLS